MTLKAEIDKVRRAQAAASSTPQLMDPLACGTQELGSFQKGKSRGKGKGKGKNKGKPNDNVPTTPCPICGKAGHWKKDCWYNIPGGWKDKQPKDKSKGKDGKDKTPANNQQQANKDKKSAKCWTATARDVIPKIVRRRNGACRLWRVKNNRHRPLVRQARQR